MAKIVIKDLDANEDMDREAMRVITGGSKTSSRTGTAQSPFMQKQRMASPFTPTAIKLNSGM